MPEVEEVEVEIAENDLKIDVYRSTGPGGQSVNTTDSAVRITHLPTGVVVSMQDEKSQLQNRQKAMRVLRARLYELEREKQQPGTPRRGSPDRYGERAEKIRTYNFPENRLTDHRIKLTAHRLDQVLEGDLGEFTEAIQAEDRRLGRGRDVRAMVPGFSRVRHRVRRFDRFLGPPSFDRVPGRARVGDRRGSTRSVCWRRRSAWSGSSSTRRLTAC